MNGLRAEATALASEIRTALDRTPAEGVDVLICPPFLALAPVQEALAGSSIRLGAQDVHWEAKGAYTGEVSTAMLREVGCVFVIVGHSERRHIMGETNEHVNRKVKAAVAQGLTPIVCVGELLEERSMGDTYNVIERQIRRAFDGMPAADVARTVIAYEPVWAIGTGKTATPHQAQEAHRFIRKLVAKIAGPEVGEGTRILYGGSVKPENAKELMAQADIDGALVGGASLNAESFVRMVRYRE